MKANTKIKRILSQLETFYKKAFSMDRGDMITIYTSIYGLVC